MSTRISRFPPPAGELDPAAPRIPRSLRSRPFRPTKGANPPLLIKGELKGV